MARSIALALLFLAVFQAAAAWAEDDPRQVFRDGVALYQEGKYPEAAQAFEKAYKLKPSYRLLFNIGQAYAACQKYDLAIRAFERYLVDGGDEVEAERRDEVLGEIAKIRPLIGFLELKVPNGLGVKVDGEDRGKTPLQSKMMLTVGHPHTVELIKDGNTVLTQQVSVSGGMVETVEYQEKEEKQTEMTTPAGPAGGTEARQPTAMQEEKKGMSKLKMWGWITGSVGAAVAIGGAVVGGLALGQDDTLSQACPAGACSPARSGEIDALKGMALTTDILLGLGGALVATGIILLVIPDDKESEDAPAASVSLVPGGVVANVEF